MRANGPGHSPNVAGILCTWPRMASSFPVRFEGLINVFKKSLQQLVRIDKVIWHAFVACMPMLVVILDALSRIFTLLGVFNCMSLLSQINFPLKKAPLEVR